MQKMNPSDNRIEKTKVECLIEIFDPEKLRENITGCMLYEPDHYYIFVSEDVRYHKRRGLRNFLATYCPNTVVHEIPIKLNGTSQVRDDVNLHLNNICNNHEEILVEICGGDSLLNVAVFYDCFLRSIPIISIDRTDGIVSNWSDAERYSGTFETKPVTIDGIIRLNGGFIERNMHHVPKPEYSQDVLDAAKYILEHEKEFIRFTSYLHSCLHTNQIGQNLRVRCSNAQKVGEKTMRADPHWFKILEKGSLMKDIKIDQDEVNFAFTSQFAKESLAIRGSWLELYIYLNAAMSGKYDEVMESVVLDWNSESKKDTDVRNEIDVILRQGEVPIFISCKMRKAQPQDLNEILEQARHFGGAKAKAMVASANTSVKDEMILKRAEEMGMHVITREELGLAGN